MFIGHYAPAFVTATSAKSPRLGALFVAAQLVDIVFFSFLILGIEHMRLTPQATTMNTMDLYDMPWTHSLIAAVGWTMLFALAVWLVLGSCRRHGSAPAVQPDDAAAGTVSLAPPATGWLGLFAYAVLTVLAWWVARTRTVRHRL